MAATPERTNRTLQSDHLHTGQAEQGDAARSAADRRHTAGNRGAAPRTYSGRALEESTADPAVDSLWAPPAPSPPSPQRVLTFSGLQPTTAQTPRLPWTGSPSSVDRVAGSAYLSGTRPGNTTFFSAAPGRSSSFSSIHKALPSAVWHAASNSSGSITRSRQEVRCTIEPVAIRLAVACPACATTSAQVAPLPRFGLSSWRSPSRTHLCRRAPQPP